MYECEICGKYSKKLEKAYIDGAKLFVCPSCADLSRRKNPKGIKPFINSICSQCKFREPSCKEKIEQCILAEMCYLLRRIDIVLEFWALGEPHKIREVLMPWKYRGNFQLEGGQ
jgi:hypothetical protein